MKPAPEGSVSLEGPGRCMNCHADYNPAVEPGFNWQGSMMAQAARDPRQAASAGYGAYTVTFTEDGYDPLNSTIDALPDINPMGTATHMAIPEISMVPAKTGMAPNAPDEPTWSERIAVWGLHLSPNRNSVTGIF